MAISSDATLDDFLRAMAIPAICRYHDSQGGRDGDWIRVREWIYREWPGIPGEMVEKLVSIAKDARNCAFAQTCLKADEKLSMDDIPGKEFPKCQSVTTLTLKLQGETKLERNT